MLSNTACMRLLAAPRIVPEWRCCFVLWLVCQQGRMGRQVMWHCWGGKGGGEGEKRIQNQSAHSLSTKSHVMRRHIHTGSRKRGRRSRKAQEWPYAAPGNSGVPSPECAYNTQSETSEGRQEYCNSHDHCRTAVGPEGLGLGDDRCKQSLLLSCFNNSLAALTCHLLQR